MNIELKDALDGLSEDIKGVVNRKLDAQQAHIDKLDIKMQRAGTNGTSFVKDDIADMVVKNFEAIKVVSTATPLEIKAVGDMLIGDVSGTTPRIFSNTVAKGPSDPVNFADLVPAYNINGGIFTYPFENPVTGVVDEQAESVVKSQLTYNLEMKSVILSYIAGYCRYSKQMQINMGYLQSFIPTALRRDYYKAESIKFSAQLVSEAIQGTIIVGNNVERLIAEQMLLLGKGYNPDIIVVNPVDYGAILTTAGPSGTEQYSLPGSVLWSNGMLTLNGVAIVPANWMAADSFVIGQFSGNITRVVGEQLNVNFSENVGDAFIENMIVARIEQFTALAVLRPDAFTKSTFSLVA